MKISPNLKCHQRPVKFGPEYVHEQNRISKYNFKFNFNSIFSLFNFFIISQYTFVKETIFRYIQFE